MKLGIGTLDSLEAAHHIPDTAQLRLGYRDSAQRAVRQPGSAQHAVVHLDGYLAQLANGERVQAGQGDGALRHGLHLGGARQVHLHQVQQAGVHLAAQVLADRGEKGDEVQLVGGRFLYGGVGKELKTFSKWTLFTPYLTYDCVGG